MLAAGTIDQLGCLVIDGDGWHRGVLGILASRVVERTGRPALVLSHEDGEAHGSGRSIPGFHLLEALESCHDVFVRFGGHAHAVGFSLTSARVPELRDRLQHHAAVRLTPQILERKLDCSAELPLTQIDHVRSTRHSVCSNPTAWATRSRSSSHATSCSMSPPQIMKDEHIRMRLRDDETVMKALGWRWAERVRALALDQGSRIDLAYRLRMNEHPDFGGLELEIVDLWLYQPTVTLLSQRHEIRAAYTDRNPTACFWACNQYLWIALEGLHWAVSSGELPGQSFIS